ncbi:hypothetical protein [Streptacidiphilus sp. PAMC 29251]
MNQLTPPAVRPPRPLSPPATRAWQTLRAKAVVHSWDTTLHLRDFQELQRHGRAVVTRFSIHAWVAELGPSYKEVLEVTVPNGTPQPPPPVADDLLRLRVPSEPLHVAGRHSRGRDFDVQPVLEAEDLAGWVYRTPDPGGSGLVFGWVSVDAQSCGTWSASRKEATAALRTARRIEAEQTATGRAAAACVHPGPHCFKPVRNDAGQLLGHTFRLSRQTTNACAWVTPGGTVSRRIHQYHEEAAAAMKAHLDAAPGLTDDEDARGSALRAFPCAYNLIRV